VQEVTVAGPVTQDPNVKVSDVVVEHPPVKPALGYRFDFKDRSIASSGDTAPSDALGEIDVLVHDTMSVPAVERYIRAQVAKGRPVECEPYMAHMKADHMPLEEVDSGGPGRATPEAFRLGRRRRPTPRAAGTIGPRRE